MELYDYIMKKKQKQLNNLAVVCENISFTYNELDDKVKKFAGLLKECGIEQGDKVAIIIKKPVDFLLFFLSVVFCKGTIVPIYQNTGVEKIQRLIKDFNVNYIITSLKFSKYQEKSNVEFNSSNYIVYGVKNTQKDIYTEEVALLMLTSGTTSESKGVLLTNTNIESNIESISKYLKLTEDDRVLLIKNLNHISSIVGELLVSLYNGSCLIFSEKIPFVNNIMNLLQSKKVTVFFAVPTILSQMIENKNISNYDFSNLRIINFYGSKMPYENIKKLFSLFKDTNIIYSYGLTEASPRVTYIEKKDLLEKEKSSGKVVDNVQVKICDEDGQILDSYNEGEIVVKGLNVMLGYYNNKELTERVLRNGELHTGDYGYMDDDGFLYVTGRRDNMIIRAGKNIHPEEIEDVLVSYPNITAALVVENENIKDNIELNAYVVCENEEALNIVNVLKYCRTQLEDYKIPKNIKVVSELKKTASGKIKRKQ